ncbi:sugar transporter [Thozetella sp. PMI_491]|nr:sugar transporter [Thozetella sp. PMI_491]
MAKDPARPATAPGESRSRHIRLPASSYDVDLALAAERREKSMSFKEVLVADLRAILASVAFSGSIVMEGYGLALITYLFSFPVFKQRFGAYEPALGGYEVEYEWRVLLPLAAQFGSLIGTGLASPLTAYLGYKRSMQWMLLMSALAAVLPFMASTVEWLAVAFLVQGIPWGVFSITSPAYSSELASLQLRPVLTTWNNLCWVLGQLLASAVAKAFEAQMGDMGYRIPFALHWLFAGVLLLLVPFAPESPYWHLQKDQVDQARLVTKKLVRHGSEMLAEERLALMQHTMSQEGRQRSRRRGLSFEGTGPIAWLRRKLEWSCFQGTDRRRTEISCMAWLIQALCGSSIVPWAPKLFEAAGLDASQSLSVNVALPMAGIAGTVGSWWLMRQFGHRAIYLGGLLSMAVLLTAFGAFSFLPRDYAGWSAGGVLVVYTAVYDLTIGPVCYSVVSEIPSIRLRRPSLAVARGCYLLVGVANQVLTPKMVGMDEESWGWGAKAGFLYAGMCSVGLAYTWFRIPTTQGISTRELDLLFQNRVPVKEFSSTKAAELERSAQPTSLSDISDCPSIDRARTITVDAHGKR